MNGSAPTGAMAEESGRVVAVDEDVVWVETLRKAGCGRCDEPGGCGNPGGDGVLLQRLRDRVGHVRALNRTGVTLSVGDVVRVGVPADAILGAAWRLYVLPLLMMLAGALIGNVLAPGDVGALAGAAGGLAAAFAGLRLLARHSPLPQQPVVLGRLSAVNDCPH